MTGDRYSDIKALFQRALDLPEDRREAFVREQSGQDTVLLDGVLGLLAAHAAPDSFLAKPPEMGTLNMGSIQQALVDPHLTRNDLAETDLPDDAPAANPAVGHHAPQSPGTPEKQCPMCMRTYAGDARICPQDAAPLIPFTDPAQIVGTTLDNVYFIEKLLGQGGMGAVYKARHLLRENHVAIKVLHKRFSSQPAHVKRFLVEGKATSKFSHPNAVIVYDMRTTPDGQLYLVQEFVSGVSLREEFVRRRIYAPSDVVEILTPIASALDAAHKNGVVHRDLKPDNIMIERRASGPPVIKLLDLGIAKIRGVASELTAEGSWIGTPAYMPPEQWGAKQHDAVPGIDGRADVYSLGIIAFELTAGRRPFDSHDIHDYFHKHTAEKPPHLGSMCPGIPKAYEEAVDRALAKQRKNRFMTASQFVAALAKAVQSQLPAGARGQDPDTQTTVQPGELLAGLDETGNSLDTRVKQSADAHPGIVPSTRQRIVLAAVSLAVISTAAFALRPYFFTDSTPPPANQPTANTSTESPAAAAPVVTFKYRIEHEPAAGAGAPQTGRYRFVFSAVRSGYLYIIVPGKGDQPTTILTAQPLPESGLTTNRIEAGTEFRFPAGQYPLENEPGTETVQYSLIFSESPLGQPEVLALPAGRVLSGKEVADLTALCDGLPAQGSEGTSPDRPAWSEIRFRDPAEAADPWKFCFRLQASSTPKP